MAKTAHVTITRVVTMPIKGRMSDKKIFEAAKAAVHGEGGCKCFEKGNFYITDEKGRLLRDVTRDFRNMR